MRIVYIGDARGTSLHRACALQRLGHQVAIIDPRSMLPASIWMTRWLYRTGAYGAAAMIEGKILKRALEYCPEVVWVNQGELVGPNILRRLRDNGARLINYINDDPFREDGERMRFRLYRKALPFYDLAVVCRPPNVGEALAAGARHVFRVWMSADEVVHASRPLCDEERKSFKSDVCFVGTWMPERGPFMARLIKLGVPLSIWGDRWEKAQEWSAIRPYWRGPGIFGDGYATAIMASKICLGLLSKGNRDLHTRRSAEIPALGSVLCAERTTEHLELYREGEEAVFWGDAEECAAVCTALLNDDVLRAKVAAQGRRRAVQNGLFNEVVMNAILEELQTVANRA